MINSEVAKSTYLIQAGVTTYPIGFEYHFNPDNTPQVAVKINDTLAGLNVDFVLSTDKSSIVLIPTPEEEEALTGPLDFSWMDRLVGKHLFVYRDIEFLQNSDYQVGRIDPEQIEKDFDESVMRDQILRQGYVDLAVKVTEACGDAEHAIEIANNASGVAAEALEVAESANEKSDEALTNSEDAVAIAASANDDARNALTKAGEANAKSDQAMGIADGAMDVATEAMDVATEAKDAVESKQDRLTPGANVTIVDNVISSTGAVHSVNGKTGAVNLTIADLGAASADEVATIKNDQDELGDQVSIIEGKIPGSASTSNQLATASDIRTTNASVTAVGDRVTTLRADMNMGLSEIQTQVTAQASAIAGKIDQQQDAGNAGKALIIGEDGVVIPGEVSSGDSFPNQTDNAGKFLQTNGSEVVWADALVNQSDQVKGLVVGGSVVTTGSYSAVVVGPGSVMNRGGGNTIVGLDLSTSNTTFSVVVGNLSSATEANYSVVIGNYAVAEASNTVSIGNGSRATSDGGIAIGQTAKSLTDGVAIGRLAQVQTNANSGVAIGAGAIVQYGSSAQIGYGTNSNAGTLQYRDWTVIDSDGHIPTERLASGGTEGQVLAKTADGMAWQDAASGGGDYLPLTGGHMNGQAWFDYGLNVGTIGFTQQGTNWLRVVITSDYSYSFKDSGFYPQSSTQELGTSSNPWRCLYTGIINNGEDLIVPTSGGTLARLEDIPESGGGDTIQFEQLPTPSADYAGKILQYIGEDGTYKSGHFYKCVETVDIMGMGYSMDGTSITVTVDTQKFLAQNPVWMDQGVLVWRADGGGGVWSVWTQDPALSLTDDELRNTWGVAVNTSDGSPYTGSNASITVQNMGSTYAWIEVELGGEGPDLSNYLQLSGGTMTGPITVEWSGNYLATAHTILKSKYHRQDTGTIVSYDVLKVLPTGAVEVAGNIEGVGGITPRNTTSSLGNTYQKFWRIHVQSIYNGDIIQVPAKAGTMALVEDIDAAVGDISTALTAIIGEL